MENVTLVDLQTFSDSRGTLRVINVPFPAVRMFSIDNVPVGSTRANHAHRINEQFYTCMRGGVTLILDNGKTTESLRLNRESQGVYVGPMIWHTLNEFEPDTIVLVHNSIGYDKDEYVLDYDEFIQLTR